MRTVPGVEKCWCVCEVCGWAVVHVEWTKVRGDRGGVGGGRSCWYKGQSVWVLLLLALRRPGFMHLEVFHFPGPA